MIDEEHFYRCGWTDALAAAREAVAAVSVRKDSSYDMRVQSLAAIDALREERIKVLGEKND